MVVVVGGNEVIMSEDSYYHHHYHYYYYSHIPCVRVFAWKTEKRIKSTLVHFIHLVSFY